MATLAVNATDDFSADLLSGIDLIEFSNLTGLATATFTAAQFDNVAILDSVELRGSAGGNAIAVTGGSVDASHWQFDAWVFGDTVTLTGTSAADSIAGSSVTDVILGRGGRDVITGGAGADDLSGGRGNDRFIYASAADDGDIQFFEQVDGGTGAADKIILDGSFDGLSLLFATVTNVEALVFRTAGFVTFSGSAFDAGGITSITGSGGSDQLRVTGSAIDLSGVIFTDWTEVTGTEPRDFIYAYGFGATSDTITGSAFADLIHGYSGDDSLDGGEGNDTLYGDEGRDTISGGGGSDTIDYLNATMLESGEVIDGGTGTDTLVLHEAAPGETYDFTGCIIANIEALTLIGPVSNADLVTVRFAEGQFGFGGILAATVNSQLLISIAAGTADLSGVDFNGTPDMASTEITGISGSDVLIGGSLTDIIVGGSGIDVMQAKAGADIFRYNAEGDIGGGEFVDGGGGGDTLELSGDFSGNADLRQMIFTKVERIDMLGSGQTVKISSTMLDDLTDIEAIGGFQSLTVKDSDIDLSHIVFTRWSATDSITLNGTGSVDSISGSAENDLIIGLGDGDNLTGNAGADIFVFTSVDDSTTGTGRDLIADFIQGEDIVDVAQIGPSITFVGETAFTATAVAELRYEFTANGNTEVSIDSDGDGVADSNIILSGQISLTAADFEFVL